SGTGTATIDDDDADYADPAGGTTSNGVTLACWNMPGGCTVPLAMGLTCSNTPAGTGARKRYRTSTTSVTTQSYTVITFPNVSDTAAATRTLYPPNYIWWFAHQIYKGAGATPPLYMGIDRNASARSAIKQLVDNINPVGLTPKVRFGLARYDA